MIRVLHIFHEMSNGGTGHFVMNYYRHIDRSKIQFDFLTSVDEPGYFDEEIRSLGGRLFHAYPFEKISLETIMTSHGSFVKIITELFIGIQEAHLAISICGLPGMEARIS